MGAKFVRREQWLVEAKSGTHVLTPDEMRHVVNDYLRWMNLPTLGALLNRRDLERKNDEPLVVLEDK